MPLEVEWPWPLTSRISKFTAIRSKITIATVSSLCKIWMDWANKVTVYNRNILHEAVENRPANQPLLTYCNHYSCIDDPVIWGILKWRHLVTNNSVLRWTLTASDICFTRDFHATFFALGRGVPVVRGEGVYQRGMDFIVEKLNKGGWVHTFPEGKINLAKENLRLKWGIGRLVAECDMLPIVIPMWHFGMDDILPNKRPYIPRVGQKVTVLIGEPVDLKDQLQKLQEMKKSPMEIRKQITDQLQEEMLILKQQAEVLHFGHARLEKEPLQRAQ